MSLSALESDQNSLSFGVLTAEFNYGARGVQLLGVDLKVEHFGYLLKKT